MHVDSFFLYKDLAMPAGRFNMISGVIFTQRMMMAAIPLTPKKMLLRQIRKMQELKQQGIEL
jgi:hypothetical protein